MICLMPYAQPNLRGLTLLSVTGPMMCRCGNIANGDNGLSAMPERIEEACAAIDEAVNYARGAAAPYGINILIEPLNSYDAPGYFLASTGQARDIINEVEADNILLMFDCYHVQLIERDLSHRITNLMPIIGHIQFASVPDRGAPDHGEIDLAHVFNVISELGYLAPLAAEYKPVGPTIDTLSQISKYA